PPTAPRDAIVTENSRSRVVLSWSPPEDPGGRTDIRYHVDCYGCGPVSSQSGIRFEPGQSLSDRSVAIRGLQPLTRYTFHVYALNASPRWLAQRGAPGGPSPCRPLRHCPNKLDAVSARRSSAPTLVWQLQLDKSDPKQSKNFESSKFFPKKDHSRPFVSLHGEGQFLVKELDTGSYVSWCT
uniref:Fibronectin type-III domain-containing protein n=1 Tax=Macrostomum lignano TaxID=282301 RepID=A0A1I8FDG6_9PLAT